jgi:hypothetical protein
MLETIVFAVIGWLLGGWIVRSFIGSSSEEQPRFSKRKLITLQIDVEQIGNLWYGWFKDVDDCQTFIAQGDSCNDAISKCTEKIQSRNPGYIILFKYKVKYDNATAVQN